MEFLNNQNNLQNLQNLEQDFEQTTVVMQVTDADEVLENNNHVNRSKVKWNIERKIELLTIEEEERKNGRQFMERVKKRWDEIHPRTGLTKQNLRDNAARFKKDKKLLNLILVRKRQIINNNTNVQCHESNEGNIANGISQDNNEHFTEEEDIVSEMEETDQDLYRKFLHHLKELHRVDQDNFEGRTKLPKIKDLGELEIKANRILEKHLQNHKEMSHVVDAVYAMGMAVADILGVKRKIINQNQNSQGKSNRSEREKEQKIKELRQLIARADNEIHRRKVRRKASKKEKSIIKSLKIKIGSKKMTNDELKLSKEEWLDKLRTELVLLKVMNTRKKRIKNNILFKENQKKLFADDGDDEKMGELPEIEKFEEYWSSIWEKIGHTPTRPWMKKMEEEIRTRVREPLIMELTLDELRKTIKKRKNWSAPGLDGIQNFWWKKFNSTWEPMLYAMKKWLSDAVNISDWVLIGRTVLLPKTKRLDKVEEFRPITCLNTIYKIFTGLVGDFIKRHVVINGLWDENQLGTREKVLGTVDLLLVDQCIMEEVRYYHRDLSIAYYDYKKAYDFVNHDWINIVFDWMRIDGAVRKVISRMMDGWKTRLNVMHNGESKKSRWIRFNRGFLQGDSFSPVGFCICEIPVLMLIDNLQGYRMGPPGARIVNKTHSLFLDDLKVYQETEEQLEIVNEMLVQASKDTGARYGVKKCCKAIFKHGKIVETIGLNIDGEVTDVLDPDKNNTYKFLGLEQASGINREEVMSKMEKIVKEKVENLVQYELYDKNLMQAINTIVVPVVAYAMNIVKFTKTDLTELDMIVKRVLREKRMHAMQCSDERLYLPREMGGRGLKSFKTVYEETKVRIACYMCKSNDAAIINTWERELNKENYSLPKEITTIYREIGHELSFVFDDVVMDGEVVEGGYEEVYRILKKIYKKGKVAGIVDIYKRKVMQSEVFSNQENECHLWLKGNLEPRKTASIMQLMEQMVETKVWKGLRGILVGNDKCRLCGMYRETVQHILAGCTILAQQEYLSRHNAALSIIITEWCKREGLMPDQQKWYQVEWHRGKVVEGNGKKVLWDFEFKARKKNIHRRPDVVIEDNEKKEIFIIDMACPMESNVEKKTNEKLRNYSQLAFEIREKRPNFKVVIVPLVIGCLGAGVKSFLSYSQKLIRDEKILKWTTQEMIKTIVFHSETIMRKVTSKLIVTS